jgi:hypothetical protein
VPLGFDRWPRSWFTDAALHETTGAEPLQNLTIFAGLDRHQSRYGSSLPITDCDDLASGNGPKMGAQPGTQGAYPDYFLG